MKRCKTCNDAGFVRLDGYNECGATDICYDCQTYTMAMYRYHMACNKLKREILIVIEPKIMYGINGILKLLKMMRIV